MRKAVGGAVHHSPASRQEEKLSKRSPCCQISTLCELKDFFLLLLLLFPPQHHFSASRRNLLPSESMRSLSDGHGEQLLVGILSWLLVPSLGILWSCTPEMVPEMTLIPLYSLCLQVGLSQPGFVAMAGVAACYCQHGDAPEAHLPIPPGWYSSRDQPSSFC